MTNARAFLLLVSLATTAPACNAGWTSIYPESCDQLRSYAIYGGNVPVSGLYTLNEHALEKHPYLAYCEMSTGETYLPLPRMGATNYSELSTPAGTLRTTFKMIKIDPLVMLVDVTDHRYASSTWTPVNDAPAPEVTELPYGVAISTEGAPEAHANIDLRGTKLVMDQLFSGQGPIGAYTGNVADILAKQRQWLSATAEPEHTYDARDRDFHLDYDLCSSGKCSREEIAAEAAEAAGVEFIDSTESTP